MLKIGTSELLLIFAVALIVFGPSKLPMLGKMTGKTLGQLKRYVENMTSELENMDVEDEVKKQDSKEDSGTPEQQEI